MMANTATATTAPSQEFFISQPSSVSARSSFADAIRTTAMWRASTPSAPAPLHATLCRNNVNKYICMNMSVSP